jgi:hypothetical protein
MIEPQPLDEGKIDNNKKPGGNLPPDDDIVPDETVENTGMDMGVTYKEDREQDLDDLVHQQGSLKKNDIPPPEEL